MLGKHSGTASIVNALHSLGLAADEQRTRLVLAQVREHASRTKQSVGTNELLEFYAKVSVAGQCQAMSLSI